MSQPSYDPEVVAIFQQQFVETYILNALTELLTFTSELCFHIKINRGNWYRTILGVCSVLRYAYICAVGL
ncbi:hypothetical protein EW026_g3263 [Hermanssonia centrifuga]|uniref:Uncharacterized protein n=1 Tax=Hermanssonia centrifuga TaxID=98765 RepID=A0A4S4KLA2_9APHY|nr:hypothetical protein EW026_g3263 [Hermanssonia centrifuga]